MFVLSFIVYIVCAAWTDRLTWFNYVLTVLLRNKTLKCCLNFQEVLVNNVFSMLAVTFASRSFTNIFVTWEPLDKFYSNLPNF